LRGYIFARCRQTTTPSWKFRLRCLLASKSPGEAEGRFCSTEKTPICKLDQADVGELETSHLTLSAGAKETPFLTAPSLNFYELPPFGSFGQVPKSAFRFAARRARNFSGSGHFIRENETKDWLAGPLVSICGPLWMDPLMAPVADDVGLHICRAGLPHPPLAGTFEPWQEGGRAIKAPPSIPAKRVALHFVSPLDSLRFHRRSSYFPLFAACRGVPRRRVLDLARSGVWGARQQARLGWVPIADAPPPPLKILEGSGVIAFGVCARAG